MIVFRGGRTGLSIPEIENDFDLIFSDFAKFSLASWGSLSSLEIESFLCKFSKSIFYCMQFVIKSRRPYKRIYLI